MFNFAVATFGAGFAIQNVLTAFESCRIRVKNLPQDAKHSEVCALFTQQGVEPWKFHVVNMTVTSNGKQEADILCQEDLWVVAVGLDGIEFREERLLFEVLRNNGVKSMESSAESHCDVLIISWRTPSVDFVAKYIDARQAEERVRNLDKKICAGRRVTVQMNKPAVGLPRRGISNNAITIKGLPPDITDTMVARFAGSTLLMRLQPIKYDVRLTHRAVRYRVEKLARGGLKSFETIDTDAIDGISMVRAHFHTIHQAKKAYDSLKKQRFSLIGLDEVVLHPFRHHYAITIPTQQYRAQKTRWDLVQERSKDTYGCNIWVEAGSEANIVHIVGDDRKAVRSLKIRAENLAAGEHLEHWHQSFAAEPDGQRFLDSVLDATGAYIRYNHRRLGLKAYGERQNIDEARAMVKSEVERVNSLKEESGEFLVKQGLTVLPQDACRDDTFRELSTLDVLSHCEIITKSVELEKRAFRMLIDRSFNSFVTKTKTKPKSDLKCPICHDEIISPVQLACGHSYCIACMQHFLTTASDTKIFPLSCMGNNNQCQVPIAIPMLQRLLSPQKFEHLLEIAFASHIERFPKDFRYCPTPDCSQVYRCNPTSLVLHCPSCLVAICASCHTEARDGVTCEACALHKERERLNDRLAVKSGFKKCPQCRVWIDKMGGCNHMSCRCGAHFNWDGLREVIPRHQRRGGMQCVIM